MNQAIRRVVTGHSENEKATFISDESSLSQEVPLK